MRTCGGFCGDPNDRHETSASEVGLLTSQQVTRTLVSPLLNLAVGHNVWYARYTRFK